MKLITKSIEKKLPKLGSTDNQKIIVKFFDPTSSFRWYVTEGKVLKNNIKFNGFVDSGNGKLKKKSFTLNELKSIKRNFGFVIMRDNFFKMNNTIDDVIRGDVQ